jgi:hypothetical protein
LVPIGSRIDLVIGEGLSDQIDVPNIIGMSWNEAKALLDSKMLSINAIWEGEITDSAFAIIYNQQPEAINELDFNNQILAGDIIDVRIMQSPSQELLLKNQPGSKKLLGSSNEDTAEVTSSTEVQMPERPIGSINRDSIKKPRAVLNPSQQRKEDYIKDNQDKIADRDNKKVNSSVIKKTGTPKKDTKESNIKHSGGISDEYQ